MEQFGVIVRSSGERTEQLCLAAVRAEVPLANVHVVKGMTPSWKAYDEMFAIAGARQYEWYLGLDADVVLAKGWYSRFMETIDAVGSDTLYDISFPTLDLFQGPVDKGNHFYNGMFTARARQILLDHTMNSTKPESSIFSHLQELNSRYVCSQTSIGWHGFAQYQRDIFYRFYYMGLRGKKQPELPQIPEATLALTAWQHGHDDNGRRVRRKFRRRASRPIPDRKHVLKQVQKHVEHLHEDGELPLSLETFRAWCAERGKPVEAEPLSYDMNRGVERVSISATV